VVAERPRWLVACAAVMLIGINPLVGFSTYNQLLGQVGGIGLAATLLALLVEPWRHDARSLSRHAVVTFFVLFGLFLWYYEILVIILPAIGLYFILHARQLWAARRRLIFPVLVIPGAVALLSGSYVATSFRTMLYQIKVGTGRPPEDTLVFPYFLLKEALSSFWGLTMMVASAQETPVWKYALGVVLFGVSISVLIVTLRRRLLSGCIVAVLSMLAALLFYRRSDFGLFKAVLYIQPFLLALLAAEWASTIDRVGIDGRFFDFKPQKLRESFINLAGVAVLSLAGLLASISQVNTLFSYQKLAADEPGGQYFNQLPGGTRLGLLPTLEERPRPASGGDFVLDSDNSVLTKITSLFTIGTRLNVLSYVPFKNDGFLAAFKEHFPREAIDAGDYPFDIPFTWTTSSQPDILRIQPQARKEPKAGDILVAAAAENSVLNRFHLGYPNPKPVVFRKIEDVSNHLAFMPTVLNSRHYFDYDIPVEQFSLYRAHIALWQSESDYFFPGRTMFGAGRYILLRVINPTSMPRLMLEVTSGLAADGDNSLPQASLLADPDVALGMIGRGSARIFSPPLSPLRIGNRWALGIDMGRDGRRFVDQDGRPTTDIRRLTSFLRDISLLSEDDYQSLKPPAIVSPFPAGLADKNLEYSGLYEDGWIAETAFMRLAGPPNAAVFNVSGSAPWDPSSTGVSELIIRVNGVEKARHQLKQGDFGFSFTVEKSDTPIRVEISANHAKPLSAGDRRPASVRLTSVGWAPLPSEYNPKSELAPFSTPIGIWNDGWSSQNAELSFPAGGAGQLIIRGRLAKLTAEFTTKMTVSIDGDPIRTFDLDREDIDINVAVPAADRPRRVSLKFSNGQDLPKPDSRHVGMLIQSISLH
jgi:hypothetical protein